MKAIFPIYTALVAISLSLVSGCAERPAAAQPGLPVVVSEAPPPTRVEYQGASPGPNYVWVPGYWAWDGHWVWISGFYTLPPRPNALWVRGNWVKKGNDYEWVRGYWR